MDYFFMILALLLALAGLLGAIVPALPGLHLVLLPFYYSLHSPPSKQTFLF